MNRRSVTGVAAVVVMLLTVTVGALAAMRSATVTPARETKPGVSAANSSAPASESTSARLTAATVHLVRWRGPVEHLFFHPLVLRPELAFTSDRLGRGFQDYFVTVREFRAILDQLWRKGWTLVDAHRAASGQVRVPAGRKPLVLSEDDVNYYAYFSGRGLASRLVLDRHGEVRAEYAGRNGVRLSVDDLVPIVDAAVAKHPEFSAEGAKGILAVTGAEGLLGEHDLQDPAARARVGDLAARLLATGWTFASHTYGHIDLARVSTSVAARDNTRWELLTRDLLGPVDLLIYPFGSRPAPRIERLLRDAGYRIQFDIDIVARSSVRDGVVVMSRRHVDGLALRNPRRLAPFFAVDAVRDPNRPPKVANP